MQNVTLLSLFAIALGAVPGALSRYYITVWCKQVWGNNFPYGTFIINMTGCLVMGFLFTLISAIKGFPLEVDLLLKTGFLGAYTTFSTYGFDTLILWRRGNLLVTIFFWLGSSVFGIIALQIGVLLAQSIY